MRGAISDLPEHEKKTGRGHVDTVQLEKAKEFMRLHPEGVTAISVANHVGCSQARAVRLMDILSEASEANDFLVYSDEDTEPTLYFIFQDDREGRYERNYENE